MDGQMAFEVGVQAYTRLYPLLLMRQQMTDVEPRAPRPLPLERRTVRRPAGLLRERTL